MSSPEVKDADEHKRPPNVMQCIVVRPSLRLREIIDTASLPIARQNFLPRKPPQLLVTGLCRAGQILALASYVGEVRGRFDKFKFIRRAGKKVGNTCVGERVAIN